MRLRGLLIIVILSSNWLSAQNNLDEIFDDPTRKISLNIGTSVSGLVSGIPNLEADLRLMDQFIVLHAGAGLIPFNYRFNITEGFKLMTNVGSGTMTQASIGIRLFKWDTWGSADMYIGPKVEFIQHRYSNLESLDKNGDFGYFNAVEGQMVYERREQNYGIILHFIYEIKPRLSMVCGGSMGAEIISCRYDDKNSSGVEWISPKPIGWTKGFFSDGLYFRFNFSLRFRVF